MTKEDETFKKLKRISHHQLSEEFNNFLITGDNASNSEKIRHFFIERGWTIGEYVDNLVPPT